MWPQVLMVGQHLKLWILAKAEKHIFDIISNVVNAIGNASDALSGQGSARAMAALDFKVPRDPQNWSFTLTRQ